MKNIVFTTTRQWNCGDEFILIGCINLIKKMIAEDFNAIIYNRHPDMLHNFSNNDNIYASNGLCLNDNSLKRYNSASFIDLVVFAGTPEWTTTNCIPLYELINSYNLPVIAIGIGSHVNSSNQMITDTISRFRLLTVRDPSLVGMIPEHFALYLPCPSIASAEIAQEKKVKEVRKIALIYSGNISQVAKWQHVANETHSYLMKLYKELISNFSAEYEFSIVCHYIDELPHAMAEFPNVNCMYSYDAKEYFDIYRRFDFVIGCRVHGIGICASLGIPGIGVSHDFRAGTLTGFLSETITAETSIDIAVKTFNKCVANASNKSSELLAHKRNTILEYIDLMKSEVNDILNLPKSKAEIIDKYPRTEKTTLDRMIFETNSQLNDITNSTSWKITRPLRALSRFVKRFI